MRIIYWFCSSEKFNMIKGKKQYHSFGIFRFSIHVYQEILNLVNVSKLKMNSVKAKLENPQASHPYNKIGWTLVKQIKMTLLKDYAVFLFLKSHVGPLLLFQLISALHVWMALFFFVWHLHNNLICYYFNRFIIKSKLLFSCLSTFSKF